MRFILARTRAAAHADANTVRANTMRSMAALGLAAALLFVGLTIVAVGGPGRDDDDSARESGGDKAKTEVLGATVGPRDDLEVASTDGGAFFLYAEDPRDNVAGSATVIVQGEGAVTLTVAGTPKGDRAVISATVENGTTRPIGFANGVTVSVDILRDGLAWKTVEPADIAVTQLVPGETATVTTEVALDGYGEYELTGQVFFARL